MYLNMFDHQCFLLHRFFSTGFTSSDKQFSLIGPLIGRNWNLFVEIDDAHEQTRVPNTIKKCDWFLHGAVLDCQVAKRLQPKGWLRWTWWSNSTLVMCVLEGIRAHGHLRQCSTCTTHCKARAVVALPFHASVRALIRSVFVRERVLRGCTEQTRRFWEVVDVLKAFLTSWSHHLIMTFPGWDSGGKPARCLRFL